MICAGPRKPPCATTPSASPPRSWPQSRGFARAIAESGHAVFACAILPEHVHMVVQRHRNLAEQMIGHFKGRATQQLLADGIHPFLHYRGPDGTVPPAWGSRGWRVYLDSIADIRRAIEYVEGNPLKQGSPRHAYPFVTAYDSRLDAIDPGELSV